MIVTDKNDRQIEICVTGSQEEPYIESAEYLDSDEEVSEDVLDYIQASYDLSFEAFEHQIMRAEDYYEGDR